MASDCDGAAKERIDLTGDDYDPSPVILLLDLAHVKANPNRNPNPNPRYRKTWQSGGRT
jgi:hypothetical protein